MKGGCIMSHVKAIGIKFIYISIIIFSLFGIFNNVSIGKLFIMSALMTGISYVVGDLMIYPRIGNVISTILDFGLAFISILILGGLMIVNNMQVTFAALAAAFFIMCIEPLFHAYMTEKVFHPNKDVVTDPNDRIRITQLRPQHITEFSEEINDQTFTEKDQNIKKGEDDNSLE